jgi:hypothetical protein
MIYIAHLNIYCCITVSCKCTSELKQMKSADEKVTGRHVLGYRALQTDMLRSACTRLVYFYDLLTRHSYTYIRSRNH